MGWIVNLNGSAEATVTRRTVRRMSVTCESFGDSLRPVAMAISAASIYCKTINS
jgi:hypothetical protein